MSAFRDDPVGTAPADLTLAEVQTLLRESSALMKDGIRLMAAGSPSSTGAALDRFDRAESLRARLPLDRFPVFRYDLAACRLNRAEALTALGGAARLAAAVAAYDDAIALLDTLVLSDDARYARRLAIAHQNRGLVLRSLGDADGASSADAFTRAIAVLESTPDGAVLDRPQLLGAMWLNLSQAQARSPRGAVPSLDAARLALLHVAPLERDDERAAEIGVKARHGICGMLGAAGLPPAPAAGPIAPVVHDVTDLVESALALVRHWEQRGTTRFRSMAADLLFFGARVYATYQPQFLDEFVTDQIDPSGASPAYVESPEITAAVAAARQLTSAVDLRRLRLMAHLPAHAPDAS